MSLKRISPEEALELMKAQGYTYLDVRSIPEFEQGHPEGAYNVPLMHMGSGGMEPNPEFMDVVQANFPKDAKLVVGCKAGGRSKRAAEQLLAAGYDNVVDQRAGWSGSKDAFGQLDEPGWEPKGLPSEADADDARVYESLKAKAGGG